MSAAKSVRAAPDNAAAIARLLLYKEVEEFYYLEASRLDRREWEAWLEMLADDIHYWMPLRKNLPFRDRDRDISGPEEVAWFDDDKATLVQRVRQLMSGIHWAEEPLSRVTHVISNVLLVDQADALNEGEEIDVRSTFVLHRGRMQTETDLFIGRREDRIRREGAALRICKRKIIIDQAVLLAKNLTVFL